jgi:hypothetical protein
MPPPNPLDLPSLQRISSELARNIRGNFNITSSLRLDTQIIQREHVYRDRDNPLVGPIALRFIRFADGECRRYASPAVITSHGTVFAVKTDWSSRSKRLGLTMATIKPANDTEEFYRCVANQSAYAAAAAARLAAEGPRTL